MHPTVPVVTLADWLPAAFDPVLIGVAAYLGWRADQFGKVFLAAIIAFAAAVLVNLALTYVGIPWIDPIAREKPTFFPVRTIGALLWASAAYGLRRLVHRGG